MDRVDESYHILAISREGRITSRDGDPWTLKCSDCHMVFGDVTLLKNHKAHFCVGSKLGDPQALQLNKGLLDTGRPPEKLDLPDDDETPRYDSSRDPKMLQLAELHGQQMEFYKHQNEELEKQREEIRRRLEELHHRQPQKDNASEELLKELREEEERSRKMLEELRRQLMEARRPINIISGPEKTPPEPESRTYTYPMIYGSSIVQEILAVKEAYIRNGGSDPEILSQLEELLAEARALEESIKNMPPKQPKQKEDSSQLISVELENKRLLEQLIQLQEQKMLNKQRGCDKDGSDMEHELRRLRRDHQRKMYEMEMQIERMRQDALLDRLLLEIQLRGGGPPTAPGPPTKIVLKQRPQAPAQPATTPQVVQCQIWALSHVRSHLGAHSAPPRC